MIFPIYSLMIIRKYLKALGILLILIILIKLRVQLSNGEETNAYFYLDKCAWARLLYKPSYFWDVNTKEPLYDVIAWKLMMTEECSL